MSTAAIPALQLSAENQDISVLATDPGAWPTAEELQSLLYLGLIFGSAALVLSLAMPLVVKPVLRRLGVVDIPNERSSHTRTVIRGMGLAVAAAVVVVQLLALLLGAVEVDRSVALVVLLGTALAAGLGWCEDIRGLSVRWRLAGQLLIGLVCAGALTLILGTGIWWWPVCAIAVVAYINVANFMDGLNGISGMHGFVVGLVYSWAGASNDLVWMIVAGLVVAFAFLGFLPWNFSRDSVFLGDVGSYLLGGSLIMIAIAAFLSGVYVEYLLPALSVYLADTGWTLLRRIRRGEAWWRPHREHVYQRLTDIGFSHAASSLTVAVFTVVVSLVGLTGLWLSGLPAVVPGLAVLAVLALYLSLPHLLGARRTAEAQEARA
ncbi:glycosyltransferase family 4 protein [Kocuria palustris]|uniref:MraY family glycosyltransferase n=1 Tax=Kocuria palustris TaxID=71999 RepID=UPI002043991D|nr:glycosyltransferase family 4 protein [Kocuria palustris]MCM3331743.1 glycosyltransferase family 4 protein [Kocuria palustris]MCT1834793.1 glycosyltransferase family 4 protein [Kocuria palustris]